MSVATRYNNQRQPSADELHQLEAQATKKVGNFRRFIPGDDGKYVHHFTWGKLCNENPALAADLLRKHVLDCSKPKALDPKERAPRGSRKGTDLVQLNPAAVQHLLTAMQHPEDKNALQQALTLLVRPGTVKACAKRLMASIRRGEANEQDWLNYRAAVEQAKEGANKKHLKG